MGSRFSNVSDHQYYNNVLYTVTVAIGRIAAAAHTDQLYSPGSAILCPYLIDRCMVDLCEGGNAAHRNHYCHRRRLFIISVGAIPFPSSRSLPLLLPSPFSFHFYALSGRETATSYNIIYIKYKISGSADKQQCPGKSAIETHFYAFSTQNCRPLSLFLWMHLHACSYGAYYFSTDI